MKEPKQTMIGAAIDLQSAFEDVGAAFVGATKAIEGMRPILYEIKAGRRRHMRRMAYMTFRKCRRQGL